jgi:hypothetical protein
VLEEKLCHELSAAPDTDLLEDRLEMVLHCVWRNFQAATDLPGREAVEHEACHVALCLRASAALLWLGAVGIGVSATRVASYLLRERTPRRSSE